MHSFLAKFNIKTARFKKAKRLWNGGELIGTDEAPRLGERWPEDVLPFWRKWAEKMPLLYSPHWVSIDDESFWKSMAPLLTWQQHCSMLLNAGQYGNLAVFNNAPSDAIQWYTRFLNSSLSYQDAMVHPRVMAWMVSKDYWEPSYVSQLMRVYQLQKHNPSIKNINTSPRNDPYTDAFLQDWCLSMVRDFNLTADEQAHFLGSLAFTLGSGTCKEKIEMACTPYLHESIDIEVLYAMSDAVHGKVGFSNTSDEMASLFERIEPILKLLSASRLSSLDTSKIHPALCILMDLQPIEKPIDLYYQIKRIKEQIENCAHQPSAVMMHFDFNEVV